MWKEKWKELLSSYTPLEKRNMMIYVAGIMLYKFGFEAFQGSITNIALDRWGEAEKYGKLGTLFGLNLMFQCIGSILVAPLIQRLPTRTVLMIAVSLFAAVTAIILIVDAGTHGRIKHSDEKEPVYGHWDVNALFPLYCMAGVVYGMIEILRRVIPRDIVGGDIAKLRQMDSLVHIFYEISGTGGAFMSSALVLRLGSNYAMLVTPIFFVCAAVVWYFIGILNFEPDSTNSGIKKSYLVQLGDCILDFGRSVYIGASIVLSHRKFVWLPIGYSMALYGHRYLENGLAPIVAEDVFHEPAYTQVIVGGSNLGELLGALSVFVFGGLIPTPIPWLRADALLLLLVWVLPFYKVPGMDRSGSSGDVAVDVKWAWRLAAIFIPISFGWAAGDVSLAAYIQASLSKYPKDSRVSSLGAVMAFLYSFYIVIFAIMTPLLGKFADSRKSHEDAPAASKRTLTDLGGIQFSVLAVILLASTLVPKGALEFNPTLLDLEDESVKADSEEDVARLETVKREERD